MKNKCIISPSKEEIEIGRLNNLINVKDTIINHKDGIYGIIPSEFLDLSLKRGLWITDDGVTFNMDDMEGITFFHECPLFEKGIFLNYPLNSDFTLKFKLNYQVIINFYLGKDRLINFRNKQIKNDYGTFNSLEVLNVMSDSFKMVPALIVKNTKKYLYG